MMQPWSENKIKYIAEINPSKLEVNRFPSTTEVTFLPMECIGANGELDLTNVKTISEVYSGFTYFKDRDVIIAKITPCFENGKGAVIEGLKNEIGFGTTELHVLRPSEKILPKFLYYVSKSHFFRSIGTATMKGAAGQKRVTDEFISQYKIVFPSITQQTKIIEYIDNSVQRIDRLIEKKQRLIKLLQEKRQSIIDEAVTKGLDPNVPMKDSGIEWLGNVPANWNLVKLKYISDIGYGLGQPPKLSESGIPILRATNIYRGKIIEKDMIFANINDLPLDRAPLLEEGEILVVRSGAYTGDSAIVSNNYEGSAPGYDLRAKVTLANSKYISYCLLSSGVLINQIYLQKLRAAQPHLNAEDLGNCFVCLPDDEVEQEKISIYIDQKANKFDTLIDKIKDQIDKLQEYRQSLISEAVTGKIDVRNHGEEKLE